MPTLPKLLKVNVSISVKDDKETGIQGDLNGLSFGWGIHLTWVLMLVFASPAILSSSAVTTVFLGSDLALSVMSLIHLFSFCITLFVTAATDQRYLHVYTSKRVLFGIALLSVLGTTFVFLSTLPGAIGGICTFFAGAATGIGSGMITLYWGVAFSRYDTMSIGVNGAVGTIFALALSTVMLKLVPLMAFAILLVVLPLIELFMLWQYTPVSYAVRHVIPIFNPLPVKKALFVKRLAPSMFFFGFALGTTRLATAQSLVPDTDIAILIISLLVCGSIVLILTSAVFAMNEENRWDTLFDIMVPLISLSLVFLPSLVGSDSIAASVIMLFGAMLFETLIWVYLGEIVQECRVSPIFVFSVGQASLGVGSAVGILLAAFATPLLANTAFGLESGTVISLLMAMILGLALLLRTGDIRALVKPNFAESSTSINALSNQLTNAMRTASAEDEAESSSDADDEEDEEVENAARSEASNVRTASEPPADVQQYPRRFKTKCEIIANRYMLSRRETEVLFFLAKGNKASYIQDKLCISKSTAKTHISHIYRKLDVHNQQELMDMVDEVSLEDVSLQMRQG